jgi:hypothetical protein
MKITTRRDGRSAQVGRDGVGVGVNAGVGVGVGVGVGSKCLLRVHQVDGVSCLELLDACRG